MPEPRPPPLTRLAHRRLAEVLAPGDAAIDATAGNGHDTLFLAQAVGAAGEVHAFDVQAAALAASATRLDAAGVRERVTLHHAGHETMLARLPALRGRVAAITFNLGYLPGGDHALTTLPATTLAALEQALALLRPGGLLSVLAYRGHPGGQEEAEAVAAWLAERPELALETIPSPGPVLHLACRTGDRPPTT